MGRRKSHKPAQPASPPEQSVAARRAAASRMQKITPEWTAGLLYIAEQGLIDGDAQSVRDGDARGLARRTVKALLRRGLIHSFLYAAMYTQWTITDAGLRALARRRGDPVASVSMTLLRQYYREGGHKHGAFHPMRDLKAIIDGTPLPRADARTRDGLRVVYIALSERAYTSAYNLAQTGLPVGGYALIPLALRRLLIRHEWADAQNKDADLLAAELANDDATRLVSVLEEQLRDARREQSRAWLQLRIETELHEQAEAAK